MSVDSLLARARSNEEKQARLHAMELRFLDAGSLETLCETIVGDYREAFALASVNLFLFDWDGALRRFFGESEIEPPAGVQVLEAGDAEHLLTLSGSRPWLGPFDKRLHRRHFPTGRDRLASVALLPLNRRSRPVGLLSLASEDTDRFQSGLGTEFLQRLGAILAVCIENSINAERLRQLGLRDPLTHLYNRRYFQERLVQAMNLAMRGEQSLSCVYLDIDHFKRINDQYGHPVGDAVLCEVARRIAAQLRVGEVVARVGGEEFALLLTDTALDPACGVAERMRAAISASDYHLGDEQTLRLSLSAGVAEWSPARAPASEAAAADLIARADAALLRAKQAGRDCVVEDA